MWQCDGPGLSDGGVSCRQSVATASSRCRCVCPALQIKVVLKQPMVFDGRYLYDPVIMKIHGMDCQGIGAQRGDLRLKPIFLS